VTTAWVVVAVLFAGTAIMRAAGPSPSAGAACRAAGPRRRAWSRPRCLGALVVYETVSAGGQGIELDARLVGLAAAGWRSSCACP
jgi:hypothetical protein